MLDAAPADARRCWRPGDTVLARSEHAVVVVEDRSEDIRGCWRAHGRRFLMYRSWVGDPSLSPLRIQGRYAAFSLSSFDHYANEWNWRGVRTWDLHARHRAQGTDNPYADADGYRVVELTVRNSGSVAYATTNVYGEGAIWRLVGARRKELDRGADVDPASLRRRGATITWQHGDEQRDARLP